MTFTQISCFIVEQTFVMFFHLLPGIWKFVVQLFHQFIVSLIFSLVITLGLQQLLNLALFTEFSNNQVTQVSLYCGEVFIWVQIALVSPLAIPIFSLEIQPALKKIFLSIFHYFIIALLIVVKLLNVLERNDVLFELGRHSIGSIWVNSLSLHDALGPSYLFNWHWGQGLADIEQVLFHGMDLVQRVVCFIASDVVIRGTFCFADGENEAGEYVQAKNDKGHWKSLP